MDKKSKQVQKNSLIIILIVFGCILSLIQRFNSPVNNIRESWGRAEINVGGEIQRTDVEQGRATRPFPSDESCSEKHSQDYQAYLYCQRIKNLNY